jgi:hypothetical protein
VNSLDSLLDITRRELIELLVVAENDNRDIDRTKNGELVGLFEKTAFALEEGSRSAACQRVSSYAP